MRLSPLYFLLFSFEPPQVSLSIKSPHFFSVFSVALLSPLSLSLSLKISVQNYIELAAGIRKMDGNKERRFDNGNLHGGDDDGDLRRGPWTVEEDMTLINYIANHGDGRWNSLARCAGNGFLAGTLTYSDSSVSEFIVRAFFFFLLMLKLENWFTGLKRTGKSCRLRWLNYLRPDVRRGNITLEEQLLILELHCRWGNRYGCWFYWFKL